jgi:hypothetical protein
VSFNKLENDLFQQNLRYFGNKIGTDSLYDFLKKMGTVRIRAFQAVSAQCGGIVLPTIGPLRQLNRAVPSYVTATESPQENVTGT